MVKDKSGIGQLISTGETTIGIELGSSRIKTVLIGPDGTPIATGSFDWENSQVNGMWTYKLEDAWRGLQASYSDLARSVWVEFGEIIENTAAIGISGMMHGYIVIDKSDKQLVPFRTWRNNTTEKASKDLTKLFEYPIPQRWSVAHLYQSILNEETHVSEIDYLTTLSGYIHMKLTGHRVLGIGDASGMFPIDISTHSFNKKYANQFDALVANKGFTWNLLDILPTVLVAGDFAGHLTEDGAKLLDPSGKLKAGIPFCAPEGDAGSGMVATNSVAPRTGNVSAGTSVFAMIVLEKELSRVYSEIDLVTTPDGNLVAMVHSNNCTSDYDAWVGLFGELLSELGMEIPKPKLYETLLKMALKGDPDGGGLLSYGYVSGEHITQFTEGRPLFVRSAQNNFNLKNFMRVLLFTPFGALRIGLNLLFEQEGVVVDEIRGHGGFFKTQEVGQKIMAAATTVPISVNETAGEGGAWGIALLASYVVNRENGETLSQFLNKKVFAGKHGELIEPDPSDLAGYDEFMDRYIKGLPIQQAAVELHK